MKFCQTHWDKLRKEVDDRGMSHLVPQGGVEAVKRLAGDAGDITNFDPLMAAHNAIATEALSCVGVKLLTLTNTENDGHYCPLCEVDKEWETASNWIHDCVVAIHEYVVEHGIMPNMEN